MTDALIAGLIGGGVTAAGSALAYRANIVRQEHRNRFRDHFERSLAAVMAYENLPTLVRARLANEPEKERVRLAVEIARAESELEYSQVWLRTESRTVAEAYRPLVETLIETVQPRIKAAWTIPATQEDSQMADLVVHSYDKTLAERREAYVLAAVDHLSIGRRFTRWLFKTFPFLSPILQRRARSKLPGSD